jgi:hypothetical protein
VGGTHGSADARLGEWIDARLGRMVERERHAMSVAAPSERVHDSLRAK